MAHMDTCWFCKFSQRITAGGFLAMAIVCFVGVVKDVLAAHWKLAGKESLTVLFCLAMIPIGVTALRTWSRALDKVLPE